MYRHKRSNFLKLKIVFTQSRQASALKAEIHRHEAAIETSLSKKYDELSDGLRKQSDRILQDNLKQSKAIRFTRYLMVVGIVLEVVIIIRIFLF